MFKTNTVALALVTAVLGGSVQAGTLDDLVAAQRAALLAEAQKKVDASKPAPIAPVAPVVVQTLGRSEHKKEEKDTSLDDAKLVAVYGPVSRLTADIAYKGAIFPVRAGGDAIEGWVADSITQSRVVLRKIDAKGKTVRSQNIYLSDATLTTTSAAAGRTGMGGYLSGMGGMPSMPMPMPMQMPMPAPMPSPMAPPAPMSVPVASPSATR